MAKATAICTCKKCGKTFNKVATCHSRREADAYETYAASTYSVCPDCYRAEQHEQATAEAAKVALPELTGSERQVAWAMDIRHKASKSNGFNSIKNETSAKWWIDNRFELDEIMYNNSYLARAKQVVAMTKSDLFKLAHKRTHELVNGEKRISYQATFGLVLKYMYELVSEACKIVAQAK